MRYHQDLPGCNIKDAITGKQRSSDNIFEIGWFDRKALLPSWNSALPSASANLETGVDSNQSAFPILTHFSSLSTPPTGACVQKPLCNFDSRIHSTHFRTQKHLFYPIAPHHPQTNNSTYTFNPKKLRTSPFQGHQNQPTELPKIYASFCPKRSSELSSVYS
ncbi:hypothetical protein IQ07DRAFT_142375 [Pyrenochaeta sp. DS3sAY3a]|nr:hypothetical protein IQ07DRAFT_142375 [Pyrenochaeta sp. DS3sAY3a]